MNIILVPTLNRLSNRDSKGVFCVKVASSLVEATLVKCYDYNTKQMAVIRYLE